jgi:UDP-N-acetylmuramoylalanine--D-glutamate ligase
MTDWVGKRVVIIGAARQGLALARYLAERGAAVVLNDQRPADELAAERATLAGLEGQVYWVCGGHPLELLDGAHLVCPSGGVPLSLPLVVEAQRRGIPLSNDSQIFLEACPCRTIGITGSAGKTTTTSLVGRMAAMSLTSPFSKRGRVWVGGNIGTPLIAVLDQIGPEDLVVMELSSFQLEIMSRSVNVAAVLNITPNHLDRHGTMAAYTAAKANILRFQRPADAAVLGRDDPGAWGLAVQAAGRVYSFGLQQPPVGQVGTFLDVSGQPTLALWDGQSATALLPQASIHLRGAHNLQNVLAACAISAAAGLPPRAMWSAVESFYGVPHRLELVRTWGGAAWYNDSIATAPERAMADILSFDEPIVLLAGGRDKDLPWGELRRAGAPAGTT